MHKAKYQSQINFWSVLLHHTANKLLNINKPHVSRKEKKILNSEDAPLSSYYTPRLHDEQTTANNSLSIAHMNG